MGAIPITYKPTTFYLLIHKPSNLQTYITMSKVYFSDMHVKMGDSLLGKFERLITQAGIDQIDFKDKFVAVKLHFGEVGNMAFLRQQYARVLCDHIKARGGKPFLTDCNTLYVGYRNNALNHLDAAYMNAHTRPHDMATKADEYPNQRKLANIAPDFFPA